MRFKIKIWILSIFCVMTVFLTVILSDTDLAPGAVKLIDLVEKQTVSKSEAYEYLMGIDAPIGENPLTQGRKKVAFILKEQEKYLKGKGYELSYEDGGLENQLLLPEGELFCLLREEGCLDKIIEENLDISELEQKHSVLIERYRTFIEFNVFATKTIPTFFEEYPKYQYISAAIRLIQLKIIGLFRQGKFEEARLVFIQNVKDVTHFIKVSDTFVGKLIFVEQLSGFLDIYSILIRKYKIKQNINLELLNINEVNLDLPVAREFVLSYYSNRTLYLDQSNNEIGMFEKIGIWLGYKVNIIANEVLPLYEYTIGLSNLKPKEFSSNLGNIDFKKLSFLNGIRNFYGNKVIDLSRVFINLDDYVARFFDLNIKISLFNVLLDQGLFDDETLILVNPYSEAEDRLTISRNTKKLCMSGPLEDKRSLRCLHIAL